MDDTQHALFSTFVAEMQAALDKRDLERFAVCCDTASIVANFAIKDTSPAEAHSEGHAKIIELDVVRKARH